MSYRETLTPEEVEQIREEARDGFTTLVDIAKAWNVELGHVKYIMSRGI